MIKVSKFTAEQLESLDKASLILLNLLTPSSVHYGEAGDISFDYLCLAFQPEQLP